MKGVPLSATIVLAIWLLITYISYRCLYRSPQSNLISRHACKPAPKAPSWDPIFGIDFFYRRTQALKSRHWLEFISKFFSTHGLNTYEFNVLGKRMIFTIEPENLKAVHVTNFKAWGLSPNRKKRVVPLIGHGVFTNDGPEWHVSRRLLRPSFEKSQLEDMALFERHAKVLLDALPVDGEIVDLQPLFYTFSLSTVVDFLLGDTSGVTAALGPRFEHAFGKCLDRLGGAGKFQSSGSINTADFELDLKIVHDTIDGRITKALKRHETEGHQRPREKFFLAHLLDATYDKVQLRSEILNNLMAGRDTTGSMLSNAWFEIAKNKQVWQRLRNEVATLEGALPTFQQVLDMPYIRAIMLESMRLYPQLPENARIAISDTVLPLGGGKDGKSPIFVPKGKLVLWSSYALHRRHDIYGNDSNNFRPERWIQEGSQQDFKPGWGYLAFGGGPRSCLGQNFALAQAAYLSIRIVQSFQSVLRADSTEWTERLALVCTSFHGCKVRLQADIPERSTEYALSGDLENEGRTV